MAGTSEVEERADVVIVGAGHAGVQLVSALAKKQFAGSVVMIEAEEGYPYERPPLSKGYFSGEQQLGDILFRSPDYWENSPARLKTGETVTRVSADEHLIETAIGRKLRYGSLVWAAGGNARRLPLPGADLEGVYYVRTRADADALKKRAEKASRAVIIGGGYIGLESAAALREAGLAVTVFEAADRLLARVTSSPVSGFFRNLHVARGVEFRFGQSVTAIVGESALGVTGVRLANEEVLPADLVIIGVGLLPNVDVLATAGCATGNGIIVDEAHRTSLPDIYAIGDCASFANAYFEPGGQCRLESVPNATDHAQILAGVLTGEAPRQRAVPWFWSDQYDIKLKTVGLWSGHDTAVVRGNPDSGAFSVAYVKDGRLIALDAINGTADFAQARLLIERGAPVDQERLADPTIKLKDCTQPRVAA